MYEKTLSESELRAEEARLAGFLGLRAMQEAEALEYLAWDELETVERISGPRQDGGFVDIEDFAAGDSFAGALWGDDDVDLFEAVETLADRAQRQRMRDAFFAQLKAGRDKQAEISARAGQAGSKAELYALLDEALAFDNLTPAWMLSEEQCRLWGLYPLELLSERVMPVVERAENRIETSRQHMRDAFFAQLKAGRDRQAEIGAQAGQAGSQAELYTLANVALAFDNLTPAWMFSEERCRAWGLHPLKPLSDLLLPAFEQAEKRLAYGTRFDQAQAKVVELQRNAYQAGADLDALLAQATMFDSLTPAWMFSERRCRAIGLRRLEPVTGQIQAALDHTRPGSAKRSPQPGAFTPVMMKNDHGARVLAYSPRYMERKLQEGYRVYKTAA